MLHVPVYVSYDPFCPVPYNRVSKTSRHGDGKAVSLKFIFYEFNFNTETTYLSTRTKYPLDRNAAPKTLGSSKAFSHLRRSALHALFGASA